MFWGFCYGFVKFFLSWGILCFREVGGEFFVCIEVEIGFCVFFVG